MNCVEIKQKRSISGLIWEAHYRGVARTFAVFDNGEEVFRISGRAMKHGGVFYVAGTLEGAENDASYDHAMSQDALDAVFSTWLAACEQYNYRKVVWGYLKYDSRFHAVLRKHGATPNGTRQHIRIRFDGMDYTAYFASLSKHVRQNIRTAHNRLVRDGHVVTTLMCSSTGIGEKMRLRHFWGHGYLPLYLRRHKEKYHISGIRHILAQYVRWWLESKKSWFLFELRIDGRLAAFMQGHVIDANELWATKLAIDSNYQFYSPGLLLVDEAVKYMMANTAYRCLNLGRGSEKYKYDMGGEECWSQDYELDLPHRQGAVFE